MALGFLKRKREVEIQSVSHAQRMRKRDRETNEIAIYASRSRHCATRSGRGAHAFTLAAIFGWSNSRTAMRYMHAMEMQKAQRVVEAAAGNQPHLKIQRFKFHVTGA